MKLLFIWNLVDVNRSDHHPQRSPHRPRLQALTHEAHCAEVYA
jgi:hypothetical protein